MSHDPKNPISNETGEYLQEVAEHKNSVVPVEDKNDSDKKLAQDKPARRTRK